ncbi:hypothetical protein BD779DRAFT_1569644 [Infundibulicybe gibba]|nr:hypothetical protein BD779DRAFT_1569644 [Infundibulicybe gibba]
MVSNHLMLFLMIIRQSQPIHSLFGRYHNGGLFNQVGPSPTPMSCVNRLVLEVLPTFGIKHAPNPTLPLPLAIEEVSNGSLPVC